MAAPEDDSMSMCLIAAAKLAIYTCGAAGMILCAVASYVNRLYFL